MPWHPRRKDDLVLKQSSYFIIFHFQDTELVKSSSIGQCEGKNQEDILFSLFMMWVSKLFHVRAPPNYFGKSTALPGRTAPLNRLLQLRVCKVSGHRFLLVWPSTVYTQAKLSISLRYTHCTGYIKWKGDLLPSHDPVSVPYMESGLNFPWQILEIVAGQWIK